MSPCHQFENSMRKFVFFTRAPQPSGALSATNHEPTFFSLLAPRLPHVMQGAKGNDDSGCEVHDDRVGEESIVRVQLSHGARLLK